MQYREPLPPDCPPLIAQDITERTVRYRLLENATPKPEDFDSYVKRNGRVNRRIRRTTCEQNGVSLFASPEAALRMMNSGLNKNRRWQAVGELTILAGAGKFNPIEPDEHQTWWPSKRFDQVKNCKVMP